METANIERQSMDVDVVCVGFGPAMGGFLTTLAKHLSCEDGKEPLQSKVMPGMPLQVLCYERADDPGFGVSGVVTNAKAIRQSFPSLEASQIPMACPVKEEKVAYLLDPVGASRRPAMLNVADKFIRAAKFALPFKDEAFELPYIPPFLQKHDGLLLSIGQFNQWVSSQLMGSGAVQIWPGMPVSEPLFDGDKVVGVRMADQGVDKKGQPQGNFMPGMDIRAPLTVVGDGPVGAIGQQINDKLGMPEGHHQRDWAVGMKYVIELPEDCKLEPGTVIHTFGYPEPEIFGFMYVYPDRLASLGIFVPSWFDNPARTSYRYLQHWMQHPYIWKHVKGGTLKSWGAKTLQEAGKRGEPHLVGDGFARIGEGSGTTNVLKGSGVDEAWMSGTLLAEGLVDLIKQDKPCTKENLEKAYVERRRQSWLEKEAKIAEKSRDGFQLNFVAGMIGMGLSGLSGGLINMPGKAKLLSERLPSLEEYYKGRISAEEIAQIKKECAIKSLPVHDALMDKAGWPRIEFDGKLLISQQDALILGGKVQAAEGFADHVSFLSSETCEKCSSKLCVEICSAQAISQGDSKADGSSGAPKFDREKCIHCGACMWNCPEALKDNPEKGNLKFRAGSGGLHSAIN